MCKVCTVILLVGLFVAHAAVHHSVHRHYIVMLLQRAAQWIDLMRSLSPCSQQEARPAGRARCIVCGEDA